MFRPSPNSVSPFSEALDVPTITDLRHPVSSVSVAPLARTPPTSLSPSSDPLDVPTLPNLIQSVSAFNAALHVPTLAEFPFWLK